MTSPMLQVTDSPVRALETAEPASVVFSEVGEVGFYRIEGYEPGPALVLTHGVHLGASSAETAPFVGAFPERLRYVLDWPGFGRSDRSARAYGAGLSTRALSQWLAEVVPGWARPVDLVGQGLGAEICARVAIERPDLVRSLVLVSPSGLGAPHPPSPLRERVLGVLRDHPDATRRLFDLLTSRPALELYYRRSFGGIVDRELVQMAHRVARQPGAERVMLSILAGDFATPNAYEMLYQKLSISTFILYDRDPDNGFELLPELTRTSPFVRAQRIPMTFGLPHFERPDLCERALREFYNSIDLVDDIEARVDTLRSEPRYRHDTISEPPPSGVR
jgi:pimeloyl-ACP methyl ester carboxylesterase